MVPLSVKLIPEVLYFLIALALIVVIIGMSWESMENRCVTTLNATHDLVVLNLERCIENCWRKHDYGRDLNVEDCYLVTLFIQDEPLNSEDLLKKEYTLPEFDSLDELRVHKLLIRYEPSLKKIVVREVE